MFPTNVLLAVDGSAGSRGAARMAITFSNALDSPLHVVLVEERTPTARSSTDGRSRAILEQEVREKIEKQAGRVREQGGRIAGVHPRVGHPVTEIARVAEEIDAGLVVVGSRGLGRLKSALLGSVSEGIVRHVDCAALVARGERQEPGPGTPLVLAIDGSRETTPAAEAAAEISRATGCPIHLVYALQTRRYRPYPGPEVWEDWEADLERAERDAGRWLEGHAEDLRAKGAEKVEAHLFLGEPDEAIVRLGDTLEAGLVVLGSRGLGGLRRALLGSVSESVVRHAGGPVLVVRRDVLVDTVETENQPGERLP